MDRPDPSSLSVKENVLGHILEIVAKWIGSVISGGGYLGIVLLMAIESACIPLPSELIMPFAGALTTVAFAQAMSREPLNIHLAALAGALGCALGSTLAYWVGAKGGREFVFKYGKYILLRRRDVEKSEAWFQKRGGAAVFIARLLPVVRTFISLPAGIARMPFGPFLLLSFIGSVPFCYLLAYVGVQFANHLDDLKKYFHGADAVIGVLLLAGFGYWLWHHLKPEKKADGVME
jgi:membrane protein DedA with SNARE-associated domain